MLTSSQSTSVEADAVPILLVDDQVQNLEVLEVTLASSGCRLVRALSADEALLALLDQDFAAIVLDIKMPGMSGLELAELIKQRRRNRDVPILFLTAHLFEQADVLRGYRTGAVDYLTKPINPEVLRSKIAVFVDLFRKTRELAVANDALQREIAERERVEEALRESNLRLERRVEERTAALQDADRRKDEFLAALAHELRNPLAPLGSAVEVLRKLSADMPELEWSRSVVQRQVQQMTRLIDDLLDVSRITRDKLVLRRERVDLAEVVKDAVQTSQPIIEQHHQDLTLVMPESRILIEADVTRLAQVLSNLLNNAAKYSEPGGHIVLTAEPFTDEEVWLRVKDTGIGIDPEMLPFIFEPFIQADKTRGRAQGGLGIGLTLVRRLVEMHGGVVQAQSEGLGHGSEFIIRLPASVGHTVPASEPEAETPVAAAIHSLRVLIVDDNRDAAEMLSLMLSGWGHDTRLAHDAMGALSVGSEFEPQVVLLDIGLPELDGYDAARRIRQETWGKQVVLAAVTGWGQESDRQRSQEAGFDHHLVKPVPPALLRALLAECALT